MYRIKLLNKDWQEVETLDFELVPNIGDYVYSRIKNSYYIVNIVVHDAYEEKFLFWKIKRQQINLVVTEYARE